MKGEIVRSMECNSIIMLTQMYFSVSKMYSPLVFSVFEIDRSSYIEVIFCNHQNTLGDRKFCVELHSILLTISPFMFWDDPKTFSKSILFLLIFWLETEFQDCYLKCLRTLTNNVLEP